MYTVVGYTINQMNCDDNDAYGDTKRVKKHYYVQEEYGKTDYTGLQKTKFLFAPDKAWTFLKQF